MQDETLKDIQEDLEILRILYSGYKNSIEEFKNALLKKDDTLPFAKEECERLLKKFSSLEITLKKYEIQIKDNTFKSTEEISSIIHTLTIELRSLVSLLCAVMTSTDWQSPTFTHTSYSEAGIQTGKIIAHINDYKRDRHLNEEEYQERFLKEYVDGFKFPTSAYLTSSGMAALTTIITHLTLQKKIKGPVLMGKSIYFENKEMIERFYEEKKVISVDEMDTEKILATFDRTCPDLLLFDSLCNSSTIAAPDIKTILQHVAQNAKKETFFVIDNSTLSIALQPLKIIRLPNKLKLIVFESLNKYHQFGLDRVTAGIVWYRGTGFEKFYTARVHAGTNIPDTSVYALPKPNRAILQKRLLRHNRNAHFLAEALQNYIKTTNPQKIADIIYPGLSNHPSYKWSNKYSFQGSYFVISFKKPFQKISVYEEFVEQVIKHAKKKKVPINGGTSFGFNTTRIYLTAHDTTYGMPFVRVSVGTENISDLRKLQDVFETVLKFF